MNLDGLVDVSLVERFAGDLDSLIAPGNRIGVAVSGGPDSLALLLLAASARPGQIEAATVDHALREDSAAEAARVASVCDSLGLQHTILTLAWAAKPSSGMQEKARCARYEALGRWAAERDIKTLLTGHHCEDQAETVLMRLARGAGVRGLSAMRPVAPVPGHPDLQLARPLLNWRRSDLQGICVAAGLRPVQDPSNDDHSFERVRVRRALARFDWLAPDAVSLSAANLARADEALEWGVEQEWAKAVSRTGDRIDYTPRAPAEIRRRLVSRIVAELASEGGLPFRGRELDEVLDALESGNKATLRGVCCSGGAIWCFEPAPPRKSRN